FAAALMFVTPNTRASATLDSIANVTTDPGSSRTNQSKMSKGANGRPAAFHPRNETATSAAVRQNPAAAPELSGRGSFLRDVDVMCPPWRDDRGHVSVDNRRQVQRDQLRHDQAADDREPQRTPRLAAR